MTKIIDPASHAVADYLTVAGFIGAAMYYRTRHREAAALAWCNAASILTLSVFTDYPGGLIRKVSFRTHGVIDGVLATMTALSPALLGFSDERAAAPFYAQAATEAGIISATDFSRA